MSEAWAAVTFAPQNDAARQVLADELSTRGDPLGEFIALHCRQAALGGALDEESGVRLRELWKLHGKAFSARFGARAEALVFCRGLPSRLRMPASEWLGALQLPIPIERLELDDVDGRMLPELLARPLTRQLTGLVLRAPAGTPWSRGHFATLLGALPARLEHLGLFFREPRTDDLGLQVLRQLAPKLRSLALGNALGPGSLEGLRASAAAGLEELDLDEPFALPWSAELELLTAIPSRALLVRHHRIDAADPSTPPVHLCGHQTASRPAAAPGRQFGTWTVTRALGARPGLDAAVVRGPSRSGLLLRTSWLSTAETPRDWFEAMPPIAAAGGALGPIDGGDSDSGEWRVFALAQGRSVGALLERLSIERTRITARTDRGFARMRRFVGDLVRGNSATPTSLRGARDLTTEAWAAAYAPLLAWQLAHGPQRALHPMELFCGPSGVSAAPVGTALQPNHHLRSVSGWSQVPTTCYASDILELGGLQPLQEQWAAPSIDRRHDLTHISPPLAEVLNHCISKGRDHAGLKELAETLARYPWVAIPGDDPEQALQDQLRPWLSWPLESEAMERS